MANKIKNCTCGKEHSSTSIQFIDDFISVIRRCRKCNESIHENYNLSSITYFDKDGYVETVYIDK